MNKINSVLVRNRTIISFIFIFTMSFLLLAPELYAQAPTATTNAATGIGGSGATVNGTVNANNSSTTVFFEYGLTTEYGMTMPGVPSPVSGTSATLVAALLFGLDPTTTYHYRVVATNASGTTNGADMTFTTTAASGSSPAAITMAATGTGADFATLNGMVLVYTSTIVSFQWGTDTNYGNTVTADQSPVNPGPLDLLTATLTGLANNTIYHYRVVAANINGTAYGADMTFTIGTVGSAPTATTNAATGVGGTSATMNSTINANDAQTIVTFEYGVDTSYGFVLPGSPSPVSGSSDTPVSATFNSFTPNTTYHYRVVATNAVGPTNGADMTFTTLALPTATTDAASSVGATTATLNGTVNANGNSTTVTFEYGGDTSYGTTVAAVPGTVTGTADTPVSKSLTGLVNGSTYHCRVVATNAVGTTYGLDMTFIPGTTPPTVTTDAASAVGTNSATLNGTVNANNNATSTLFEYGTTTAYGRTVIATPSPVTGATNTAISAGLTDLLPNTTYHYRAVGSSLGGTTYGADMTFTTLGPAVAVTGVASPVSTTNATLNGIVTANNFSTIVTFEYGTTTAYGTTVTADQSPVTGTTTTAVSKAITGLTSGTTYHYRVIGVNANGTTNGTDMTFYTGASAAPTATTTIAEMIKATSAILNGTINANNASTAVTFEYGTDTSYDGTPVTAVPSPVLGSSDTQVSYSLSGLTNGTTYHYRVAGVNTSGTTYGAYMTFTATDNLAAVQTNAATSVGAATATLHGVINPNNSTSNISVYFQYETNLTFVNSGVFYSNTEGFPLSLAIGYTDFPVSNTLTGLTPNTTYYYRVMGITQHSPSLVTYGKVMSFTTPNALAAPTATTEAATTPVGSTSATVNGTVNANGSSATVTFEYGLDTSYGKVANGNPSPVTGSSDTDVSSSFADLQPNTTYHYRVVAQNADNTVEGVDMTFETTGVLPTATTLDATVVSGTGATLNGVVSAGNDNTTVIFRYGDNFGFGTEVNAVPNTLSGISLTPVSAVITGLAPDTHYFYRIDATNSAGLTYGETKIFYTGAAAPSATTNAASGIGATIATLKGSVIANNADATVTFEYGTTIAYGKTVTATPNTVTGSVNTAVSSALTGLVSGTLYHYSVVAVNSASTSNGADVTFATATANDFDGDGVPDATEGTADRDFDGTQNYQDYDPTGYFYDEADSKIIAGGLINLSGPGAVTIIHNGSSGYYQFLTDGTTGIYTMAVTLPPGYAWSPTCLVTPGALDPTGQPNTYVLGNGENGNTGYLTSNACTQFFLQFDLAPGDPFIFNNNFPLEKQDPTSVSLSSFSATPGQDGISIQWITESEPNNAGFNIYRSSDETGDYLKVNESLITAFGNATTGATYEYVDKPEQAGDYYYKLQIVSLDGNTSFHGPIFVGLTSVDVKKYAVPAEYSLSQNYPNPFNPETTIEYGLPSPAVVEITIYNINGKLVRTLISEEKSAGNHRIKWDARDKMNIPVSSGLYFYHIKATELGNGTGFSRTLKMILMK